MAPPLCGSCDPEGCRAPLHTTFPPQEQINGDAGLQDRRLMLWCWACTYHLAPWSLRVDWGDCRADPRRRRSRSPPGVSPKASLYLRHVPWGPPCACFPQGLTWLLPLEMGPSGRPKAHGSHVRTLIRSIIQSHLTMTLVWPAVKVWLCKPGVVPHLKGPQNKKN